MKTECTEEEIVKYFVRKDKQERLIWELNTPRKRESVFWHFSGPGIFQPQCLRAVDYMSCSAMEQELFRLSGAKDVYYLGESYIGKLSLKQATEKAHAGEICVIYCGQGIGYYQGEPEYGKPPRFLLFRTM